MSSSSEAIGEMGTSGSDGVGERSASMIFGSRGSGVMDRIYGKGFTKSAAFRNVGRVMARSIPFRMRASMIWFLVFV